MVSIIIPAREEKYLKQTIRSVLDNAEGEIEVIVLLDGYVPNPQIHMNDERVKFIHYPKSIGQRKCINEGVKMAKGKYIMKLDAHCAVGKGFDVILSADCNYDWTVIPRMYNLDIETFLPKKHKLTDYLYISSPDEVKPFRAVYYTGEDYKAQHGRKELIDDTMCCMGPCFFMWKSRFWELDGCDENHVGGWGQQGIEVALKAWLSGGSLKVNKKTWFAHYFRGGSGPGFPYPISGAQVSKVRRYSQDLWLNNKWPHQTRNFHWLIDKFDPPGWKFDIDVSVIIPARNEIYLQKTIDGLLDNLGSKFEIMVGVDGYEPNPPLKEDSRVRVYRVDKSIGMRPMINKLVSMAKGQYLLRADAHIIIEKNMDLKMIDSHKAGFTVVARRYELDTPSWKMRKHTDCDYRYLTPLSDSSGGLRSLAWEEYELKHKANIFDDLMTCSGSNWLMKRSQWNRWGGLDENHGTFGQEGAEIACMTWLSGGRMIINKNTWYAHWNRGKMPYALGAHQKRKSIDYSIDKWVNNKWEKRTRDFQWLIDRFRPPGWETSKTAHLKGVYGFRVKYISVDKIFNNFVSYSNPLKNAKDNPRGTYELMKTFIPYVDKIAKGIHTYSSNEPYYQYLKKHLHFSVRDNEKGARHIQNQMQDAVNIYKSIEKDGMHTPIDMVKYPGARMIIRGSRRLIILKKLGIKNAIVRVHESMALYLKNVEWLDIRCSGKTETAAIRQFRKIGLKGTDKYWHHNYTHLYDKHLNLNKKPNILEIGVKRGASIKMWKDAYPKATITGVDIADVSNEPMVRKTNDFTLLLGSQNDKEFLKEVAGHGKFDLIIDDGSHQPVDQIISFEALWGSLNKSGVYIIEDICSGKGRTDRKILVNKLNELTDNVMGLNGVRAVALYSNICFIHKAG